MEDTVGSLAETEEPLRTLLRRGEVQVGQLRNGVTERIVHLPFRPITAVHVDDDPLRHVCRTGSRKGFDPIPNDEDDVAAQPIEHIRHLRYRSTGRASDRHGRAVPMPPRHRRVDRPTVSANLPDRPAMLARQVHAGHDQLQLEDRMSPDRGQRARH
ncbi:MAG: hypothetical protein QM770_18915 [Tepidisphaeraceae bacterium]